MQRGGSSRPVLPAQAGDPAELGCTRRDYRQSAPQCLTGDQQVVGANRSSDLLQGRAYPAGGLGVFVIEVQQIQFTGQQNTQALCILLRDEVEAARKACSLLADWGGR